jgi:hypothetical protein
MQKLDHNIGFWEKRQFFRRKLAKIAENCDHNIDSWTNEKTFGMYPKLLICYPAFSCIHGAATIDKLTHT